MIFGLRHPIVLLPATDYTDEELDLIFEHELTHYKHRDIYANLLVLLVKAAHWFNPIVAFACKEVQEAAESYCDYSVLSQRDQAYRSFYGETIITMIHKSQQPVCFLAVSIQISLISSVVLLRLWIIGFLYAHLVCW